MFGKMKNYYVSFAYTPEEAQKKVTPKTTAKGAKTTKKPAPAKKEGLNPVKISDCCIGQTNVWSPKKVKTMEDIMSLIGGIQQGQKVNNVTILFFCRIKDARMKKPQQPPKFRTNEKGEIY